MKRPPAERIRAALVRMGNSPARALEIQIDACQGSVLAVFWCRVALRRDIILRMCAC